MNPEVEKAFQATTKVLFGKALAGLPSYRQWLEAGVRIEDRQKSAVSSNIVYAPRFRFYQVDSKHYAKLEESLELGKKMLAADDAKAITLSNAASRLGEIAYCTPEIVLGTNTFVEGTGTMNLASHCSDGTYYSNCKYCAYSYWPRNSEYMFGSDIAFSSKFCIRCFNSSGLARCLELSQCSNCSDCFFCHNCENLEECMFCTNAKALRYAIFNKQYGKEEYLKIKKMVLDEIADKLGKNKTLDINIFNIGCKR